MPVLISMLLGINVGGNHMIPMEALRRIYEGLGFSDVKTYVQSGNVVFRTTARDHSKIPKRIEDAIEKQFKFRPSVIVRTPEEMKDVIARNPFAGRDGIENNKLLVVFLANVPVAEALAKARAIQADPEELHVHDRELFIYFTNGMARPKLPFALLEKTVKVPGTGRNWNTVTKLLKIAEELN